MPIGPGSFTQLPPNSTGPKLATGPTYTENANVVQDEKVVLGDPYVAAYMVDSGGVLTTTSLSHALQIMAGASLKVRIKRIFVTQDVLAGSPTHLNMALFRLTTAGTGGGAGLGNNALDSADAAPGATIMTLPTTKGTEGARLMDWSIGLNSVEPLGAGNRFEWVSPINMKPIIIPAGVANGIAFSIRNGIATSTIVIVVQYDEAAY